jgi:hypothetical protein
MKQIRMDELRGGQVDQAIQIVQKRTQGPESDTLVFSVRAGGDAQGVEIRYGNLPEGVAVDASGDLTRLGVPNRIG